MYLRSPCKDSEGGLGISKWGLPRRGDSGGGVSQPISDTGDPFVTYGVASRMYFTGMKKRKGSVKGRNIIVSIWELSPRSLHLMFFDETNCISRRTYSKTTTQNSSELIFHHTCTLGLNQSKMKAGNPYANHFTPTAVLSEEINSPHICIVSHCIASRVLQVLWQANELEAKASAQECADMVLQPPCFSGECHAEGQLFQFHLTA